MCYNEYVIKSDLVALPLSKSHQNSSAEKRGGIGVTH